MKLIFVGEFRKKTKQMMSEGGSAVTRRQVNKVIIWQKGND